MATIREEFFDKLTGGAKWDVGVSINRTNGVPLDVYSVFETETELNEYVAGVFAYPGQVLALVEADATTIYYIDQNKELQEVGKMPVGDNRTIEVVDGKIQLKATGGTITTEEGTSYVAGSQLTLQNDGTLAWVKPDTTTIEGLNTAVDALEKTVNGYETEEGEAVAGLTGRTTALETKATTLQEEIDAVEKDLADNYYDKEEVDGLVSGAFHFKGNADHFDEEGNLWIDAEEETLAVQIEGNVYQVGDKEFVWDGKAWVELGFNIDLTSYATKAYVGTAVSDAKTEIIGAPAEGEEADSSANTITGAKKYAEEQAAAAQSAAEATAQDYVNTVEQNAKDYTDDEIGKLNITQYATNDALNGVKETAEAALPKATYDSFIAAEGAFGVAQSDITTLKGTVAQHTTDIGTAQSTANEAKTAASNAQLAAEAAQTTADKAVVANTAITAGTHTKITYDEKGLVTAGGDLTAADIPTLSIEKISGLQEALDGKQATGDYATKTEVATAKSDLLGTTDDPATAETIRGAKAAAAEALGEAQKKANSTDVYSKTEADNTFANKATTLEGYGITDAYTKTATDEAIAAAISPVDTRLTTAESEIDTLQETIKGLSGAMHFEGVVESDPTAEDFDKAGYEEGDVVIFGNKEYVFDGGSFKEFGDASINAEAISGLAERVGANEAAITNLGKADEDNLAAAKKYTDDAIAAIPEYELPIADADTLGGVLSSTGDNAVTVAADGKMSVETVNANTLTQTSGDFLVLKGGNASSVLRMKETITE